MSDAGDTIVVLLASRCGGLGICEREALRAALAVAADLELPAVAITATDLGRREPASRIALRAGCARAVAVAADPERLDYLGIARVLAEAVRGAGPRLVLCGDQSESHRRGAVGPAVAELLGLPHLSGVQAVDVVDGEVRCLAGLDSGATWMAAELPALLCVRRAGRPAPRLERSGAVIERREGTADPVAPARRIGGSIAVSARGGAAITNSAADLVRRLREDHLIG